MFSTDIDAKFNITPKFFRKKPIRLPNNSDKLRKGHKITSKFCCAIQKEYV